MNWPNVEAPGGLGADRAQGRAHIDGVHFAGSVAVEQVKVKATITAQLALRGYVLTEIDDGSFMVGRWALVRLLPDLDAVRDFAAQVGAL